MNPPADWGKLLARLQSVAERNSGKGLTIMNVKIILVNGELKGWCEPGVTSFEPGGAKQELLEHLTDAG